MKRSAPSVVLLHPDGPERASLALALAGFDVLTVGSRSELSASVRQRAPEVVISHSREARRVIRELDAVAPRALRVFLRPGAGVEGFDELVEAAAEGHQFHTIEGGLAATELSRRLHTLIRLRGAFRSTQQPLTAQFSLAGERLEAPCLDVSSRGASFFLDPAQRPERFLPGTELSGFSLSQAATAFVTAPAAIVRQVTAARDRPGFRVGVVFAKQEPETKAHAVVPVTDPVRVLAVLRRALRRNERVLIRRGDSRSESSRLEGARLVRREGDEWRLVTASVPGWLHGAAEAVELVVELGGISYAASVAALRPGDHGGLELTVPHALRPQHRRGFVRFLPDGLGVKVRSPFDRDREGHALIDIHLDGLSFEADLEAEVFPPGTRLDALALVLPSGEELACPAIVRSCEQGEPSGEGRSPVRVGVQFTTLPAAAREAIVERLIRQRSESCLNGARVPFSEIWETMEAARYNFHPDYAFETPGRPYLPALADTHRRLYGDLALGTSIACRDGEQLVGQAAGLRIHSRTWLVQHLAVRPSFRRSEFVAHDMSSLVVEVAEALKDVDFIRYSWRLDNRYMTRLSGWLARVMNQPNLSWVRNFTYMRRAEGGPLPAGKLPVREGTREDALRIERVLRARGETLRLLAEDLVADEISVPTLRDRFAAAGLERGRHLFAVDLPQGQVAYALAEVGAPGINLIEKTNALYFIVPDYQAEGASEALASLLAHCDAFYRARGRDVLVVLANDPELALLEAAGFRSLGRFAEWFFHRTLIRTWYNLSRSLFERVDRRADRKEQP